MFVIGRVPSPSHLPPQKKHVLEKLAATVAAYYLGLPFFSEMVGL